MADIPEPRPRPRAAPGGDDPDRLLVIALRGGDEQAFAEVVRRFHPMLRRVARGYVHSEAAVDDVLQETWLGVLRGLDRFEGRSSLRTWVVAILVNVARTVAVREGRTVPVESLSTAVDVPTVDPSRFRGASDPWPGHWVSPPASWARDPQDAALAGEVRRLVRQAVSVLPPVQRTVIMLRDVEGWPAEEVCAVLEITPGNQRVLLHRARAHVRRRLDGYLSGGREPDDASPAVAG